MKSNMGLESLIQRGKSPLFLDMTSLYQESFDALQWRPGLTQEQVFFALRRMGFDSKLKDIVKKHMGFELSFVDIVETPDPNLMARLATNRTSPSFKSKKFTHGMMMEEINRVYNHREGRLQVEDKGDFPYKFKIDVNTALWVVQENNQQPYFTAEEIAAATLHELGHIDHYVRTAYRVRERIIDSADIIDYIHTTPDSEVILALIAALKKSPYLDKSWQEILVTTETYFKTSNSVDDTLQWEALSTLSTIVAAELSTRNIPLIQELGLHRIGDKVNTRLDYIDQERTADEFATRNGAYAALHSFVAKSNQLATTKTDLVLRQFLWYTPSLIIGLMIDFFTTFNLFEGDVCGGYDPIMRRLELMIQTAKFSFHDANLSAEAKSDIQKQIVEMEEYFKAYESTSHQKTRAAIRKWKDDMRKFGRILTSPVQNRLSSDYAHLQESTRAVARNPLYYLANKK